MTPRWRASMRTSPASNCPPRSFKCLRTTSADEANRGALRYGSDRIRQRVASKQTRMAPRDSWTPGLSLRMIWVRAPRERAPALPRRFLPACTGREAAGHLLRLLYRYLLIRPESDGAEDHLGRRGVLPQRLQSSAPVEIRYWTNTRTAPTETLCVRGLSTGTR